MQCDILEWKNSCQLLRLTKLQNLRSWIITRAVALGVAALTPPWSTLTGKLRWTFRQGRCKTGISSNPSISWPSGLQTATGLTVHKQKRYENGFNCFIIAPQWSQNVFWKNGHTWSCKIGSGLQQRLPLIYNRKDNKHLNHIVADGTVELNVSKQPGKI